MARDKASIRIDGQELFTLFYEAQFAMAKRDQSKLGARLQDHCERLCAYYELAWDADPGSEEKQRYINKMTAEFSIIKMEVRFADRKSQPIIKDPKLLMRIEQLIVRMDESILKWRKSNSRLTGTH